MSDTKRISKRSRTSVRLKKADTRTIQPAAAAKPAPLKDRARAARIEAVREAINVPDFNLDAAFAKAVTKLIEREID
jgi:hypothetical protein